MMKDEKPPRHEDTKILKTLVPWCLGGKKGLSVTRRVVVEEQADLG